jgi:hypothetical protein
MSRNLRSPPGRILPAARTASLLALQDGGVVYSIFRLFAYFTVKRHFILLPLLFILLLLGLVFFFISSTVIAPFIYTLF